MKIDLSIIIPAYNPGPFLAGALESVLRDIDRACEIILIDDGSVEPFPGDFSDPRIRFIRHAENRGIAATQNRGLAEARGELVTFLDQDDLLLPDGVHWRREFLHRTGVDAVAGVIGGIIDGEGQYLGPVEDFYPGLASPPEYLTLDFFRSGREFSTAMWLYAFRRSLLEKVGEFDESLKVGTDRDYLFRLLEHAPIPVVPKPVLLRRLHENNLSGHRAGSRFVLNRRTIAEGFLVNLAYGINAK